MRNMLVACCDGILTIGLKNIIESCLRIENPYIKQRRIANPPRLREHPPRRATKGTSAATEVLLRNMLAACCNGIITIGLKNIIESCLRIENPYIKQRRIANPPQRREHPLRRV